MTACWGVGLLFWQNEAEWLQQAWRALLHAGVRQAEALGTIQSTPPIHTALLDPANNSGSIALHTKTGIYTSKVKTNRCVLTRETDKGPRLHAVLLPRLCSLSSALASPVAAVRPLPTADSGRSGEQVALSVQHKGGTPESVYSRCRAREQSARRSRCASSVLAGCMGRRGSSSSASLLCFAHTQPHKATCGTRCVSVHLEAHHLACNLLSLVSFPGSNQLAHSPPPHSAGAQRRRAREHPTRAPPPPPPLHSSALCS